MRLARISSVCGSTLCPRSWAFSDPLLSPFCFDRLAQITRLTEQAIADQTNVTSIGASAQSAAADQAAITRSIDVQTDALASRLDVLIANQVALGRAQSEAVNYSGGGRSSEPFPALIANF